MDVYLLIYDNIHIETIPKSMEENFAKFRTKAKMPKLEIKYLTYYTITFIAYISS